MQPAARDLPKGKAAGPDVFPSEICYYFTAAHFLLARPNTDMIEEAFISRVLKHVCVALLDKPAKDPRIRDNGRPFALLSPPVKLVGIALAFWLSAGGGALALC